MAETQTQPGARIQRPTMMAIPPSAMTMPVDSVTSRLRNRLTLDTFSPVNQNGSFEFDRVIKCGYVQKRTQKTKVGSAIVIS